MPSASRRAQMWYSPNFGSLNSRRSLRTFSSVGLRKHVACGGGPGVGSEGSRRRPAALAPDCSTHLEVVHPLVRRA